MPSSIPSFHSTRLQQLDKILCDTQWLWRPQPFKEARPAWCGQLPQLTTALLDMSDATLAAIAADDAVRLKWLLDHLPVVVELAEWAELPCVEAPPSFDVSPHFSWEIPGRKWTQITAFAGAVGPLRAPLLEWCGGKGHLGRLLGWRWQQPVVTLELNESLCHEGERLAERAHVPQRFEQGCVEPQFSTAAPGTPYSGAARLW